MADKPSVISIDPPFSKDLDDAIAVERHPDGGWTVDACIPDVPSLVTVDGAVDRDARARVMTRYGGSFIREPMLPDEIVTALSLSPFRRTAMCWFRLTLADDLSVSEVKIATIRHSTAHRMTYLEADAALADEMHPRHASIAVMWELAMRLHARRRLRTGAAFDPENHLYTTEEGLVAQLSAKESHRTHLLVMEIMILVNEALAIHARDVAVPVIYRNHRPRDASSGLREDVVREMKAAEGMGSAEAAELLRHIASRIGPATFGVEPQGHWGLDVPAYAWFTSPLRRYCDIVNLRALVHGQPDVDAVATASHIDGETRRAKESTSQHHGLRSRAQIARSIRGGDAGALADWDLHTILRSCAENGVIDPMVDIEVRNRVDASRLTGKDIESVFTHGRDVLGEDAVSSVTAWIFADAQRQIVLARDMVVRQRIAAVPALSGGAPDVATAMTEIAGLLGMQIPEGYGETATDDGTAYDRQGDPVIDHPNPKGALLELATARHASVEFTEKGRVGPAHEPRFTVEASWTLGDGRETASASASSVKAASKAAAWEILSRVAGTDAPTPVVQPPANGDGKPAKNVLLEHATRHKGSLSYSPARMTGPPHQPTFTVEAVYRVGDRVMKAVGAGGSRKEAERIASVDIISQI